MLKKSFYLIAPFFFFFIFQSAALAYMDCECICGTDTSFGRTDTTGTCTGKCSDESSPWYKNCQDTTSSDYYKSSKSSSNSSNINFTPSVEIPGFSYDSSAKGSTKNIANYLKAIYNYGVGIVGILAAVGMIIGGFVWLTAGGNTSKVGEAQAWIGSSLTGLILVMFSYVLLNTINPDLIKFKVRTVRMVSEFKDSDKYTGLNQADQNQVCTDECKTKGQTVGEYNASSGECKCGNSGYHKACVSINNSNTYKCDISPGVGSDTCSSDNDCIKENRACCQCVWTVFSKCQSGFNLTSSQCSSLCKSWHESSGELRSGQECVENYWTGNWCKSI